MENSQIEPEKIAGIDRQRAGLPKDHIPGWGMDADPDNNPTYPMKHYTGADHERFNYVKPPKQPVTIEVLHSIERPGLTHVFGTSTPPRGISGQLRRYAYKHSEATTARWMTLILADRVDMVEGLVEDFRQGIIPNIFKERGWTAEWKYNRKGMIRNAVIAGIAGAALLAVLRTRKKG